MPGVRSQAAAVHDKAHHVDCEGILQSRQSRFVARWNNKRAGVGFLGFYVTGFFQVPP